LLCIFLFSCLTHHLKVTDMATTQSTSRFVRDDCADEKMKASLACEEIRGNDADSRRMILTYMIIDEDRPRKWSGWPEIASQLPHLEVFHPKRHTCTLPE
jgi:hypothetical protein